MGNRDDIGQEERLEEARLLLKLPGGEETTILSSDDNIYIYKLPCGRTILIVIDYLEDDDVEALFFPDARHLALYALRRIRRNIEKRINEIQTLLNMYNGAGGLSDYQQELGELREVLARVKWYTALLERGEAEAEVVLASPRVDKE